MAEATDYNYKKRKPVKPISSLQLAADLGKLPPQAVDLEEAVLGALMLEKNTLTMIPGLRSEIFYKEAHQKIFAAIKTLFNAAQPVDILLVTQQLKKTGELELIGGPYYISQLTNRVASAANIEFHCRIILQKFIQREIIRIGTDAVRDAYEDTTDVLKLLERIQSGFIALDNSIKDDGMNTFKRHFIDLLTQISGRLLNVPYPEETQNARNELKEIIARTSDNESNILDIGPIAIDFLDPMLPVEETALLREFLKQVIKKQEEIKVSRIIDCAPMVKTFSQKTF